jgi:hypothetical protein
MRRDHFWNWDWRVVWLGWRLKKGGKEYVAGNLKAESGVVVEDAAGVAPPVVVMTGEKGVEWRLMGTGFQRGYRYEKRMNKKRECSQCPLQATVFERTWDDDRR